MGNQDLERLHPVYRACVDFGKLAGLPFEFKEDSGNFETAIEFLEPLGTTDIEMLGHHPPISSDWKGHPNIICPDILDYKNRIIIEFEEETGNRKPGARYAKKGHGHEGDYSTRRDTRRNEYYKLAGFRVFSLWESVYKNENWKKKLFAFLLDCDNE